MLAENRIELSTILKLQVCNQSVLQTVVLLIVLQETDEHST